MIISRTSIKEEEEKKRGIKTETFKKWERFLFQNLFIAHQNISKIYRVAEDPSDVHDTYAAEYLNSLSTTHFIKLPFLYLEKKKKKKNLFTSRLCCEVNTGGRNADTSLLFDVLSFRLDPNVK